MTDHYSVVEAALIVYLRTLSNPFFPAGSDKPAGWQVTDDDALFNEGADYFIIVRPGEFPVDLVNGHDADVAWHVKAIIYVRFKEYKTSWTNFKTFRSAIFNLLWSDRTMNKTNGVWNVTASSKDDAGRLLDTQGNPMNWIAQMLDITITQRIKIR